LIGGSAAHRVFVPFLSGRPVGRFMEGLVGLPFGRVPSPAPLDRGRWFSSERSSVVRAPKPPSRRFSVASRKPRKILRPHFIPFNPSKHPQRTVELPNQAPGKPVPLADLAHRSHPDPPTAPPHCLQVQALLEAAEIPGQVVHPRASSPIHSPPSSPMSKRSVGLYLPFAPSFPVDPRCLAATLKSSARDPRPLPCRSPPLQSFLQVFVRLPSMAQ